MIVHSLASSSTGNACLVDSVNDTEHTQVLIDAGISWKQVTTLSTIELTDLKGIIVSHEHLDHLKGAGVGGRRTDATLYLPEESFEKRADMLTKCDIEYIQGGDSLDIGNLTIDVFSTRHDSRDSVGFVTTEKHTGKKFGYLTDTGSINKLIRDKLIGCDAYLLEADYDETLLDEYEDYDIILKDRIRSPWGHLGNDQTFEFIQNHLDLDSINWILFGHISARTNSADIIINKAKEMFPEHHTKFSCAPTNNPLEV